MQTIPPRLNSILRLLLDSLRPVSVKEISDRLGVSRRTVFRELENIDLLLRPFSLALNTVAGKGLVLEGDADGQGRLRDALEGIGSKVPIGRQERQAKLALMLIGQKESQKLFYYSSQLKVSEATISKDLDKMEPWFREFQLILVRGQSLGVHLKGRESSIRQMCISILQSIPETIRGRLSFPSKQLVKKMAAVTEMFHRLCSWMTPESKEALFQYLLVSIERMQAGFAADSELSDEVFTKEADTLAEMMESAVSIPFSTKERAALSVVLSAYRSNTTIIPPRDSLRDAHLLPLAYQLIEAFDPFIAPVLKLDENLLDGLVFHLRPALIRLENHIELQDPLLYLIADNYPEIMTGCTRAVKVLAPEDGCIPESEISFLAMHFGAAVHRLGERGITRRTIGIVCLNGIGTSYMLAAQIRKYFSHIANIEIRAMEYPQNRKRCDLLISTIPLTDVDVPFIIVPPLLDDESLEKIRDAIDHLASNKYVTHKMSGNNSLSEQLESFDAVSSDIRSILEQFDTIKVSTDCSIEELAKLAGYRFGDGEETGKLIYSGLMAREQISTQVVPQLEIVLFHCRTLGVRAPVFALFHPENGRFTSKDMGNSRCCVLLIIPEKSSQEQLELMGSISSALVENEAFLEAIRCADKERVQDFLEELFRFFIHKHANRMIEG